MSTTAITFKIDFSEQKKDGLVDSSDLIAYLQSIMKVRNSKVIASKVLNFKNNDNTVELSCNEGDVIKRNLKIYVKRYLRTKGLYPYVKVGGDSANVVFMKYRNEIVDEEDNQ